MKTQLFKTCYRPGLLILIVLTLFSCGGDRIVANKDIVTENRAVAGFEHVDAGGANNIHVNYGERFMVELKGSSNLIAVFETKVKGKVLTLSYNDDVNIDDDDVEVFVTMPALNGVSLSGSGDMDIAGAFPEASAFSLRISGSGDAAVKDRFSCSELEIEISGSGKAELSELEAVRANVNISGSGDAYVRVEEELDVRINGSGTVYYHGTPRVKSDINGSGQVTRL